MICTTQSKDPSKRPGSSSAVGGGGSTGKQRDDERVIVGCKVSIKKDSIAQVQVYINIEKHLMLCIANGKVKERFDLSQYDSFLPVVKYDGDAHKYFKVITGLQFDMQVP